MQRHFYFSRSKINSYKKFYPAILSLALVLPLAYYAARAFINYYHAASDYQILITQEKDIRNYLSKDEFQKLEVEKGKALDDLENLSHWLKKYHSNLLKEPFSTAPEQFQDELQKDILAIQEKAKRNSVIVPPSFFLSLSQYAKTTPLSQNIDDLNKQRAALFWIVEHLCEYSHLRLLQFHFENEIKIFKLIKGQQLGDLAFTINTSEPVFQKLFNEIVNAPYFFIIENLTIENSSTKGPAHSLESNDESIKIILGREKLTVSMIIKFIDLNL